MNAMPSSVSAGGAATFLHAPAPTRSGSPAAPGWNPKDSPGLVAPAGSGSGATAAQGKAMGGAVVHARARVEMAEIEKIPASIGRELGDALLEAILNWKANQSQRGGVKAHEHTETY